MSTPNPEPRPLGPADALGDGRALFKRPVSPWPSPWEQRNGIVPEASDDWRHAWPAGSPDVATVDRQRQAAQARVARWHAYVAHLSAASAAKYADDPDTPAEWFE